MWKHFVPSFFFFSKQKYLTRACVQIDVKTFCNQFSSSKNISLEPRYKLVNTSIVRKKVCTVIWMAQGPAISNRNIIFLEVCKKNKKWQTERAYYDKFNTKITNYVRKAAKNVRLEFLKKKKLLSWEAGIISVMYLRSNYSLVSSKELCTKRMRQ